MFVGTTEQFLEHCSKLDADAIALEAEQHHYNECIQYIQNEYECDATEAADIYKQIQLMELQQMVDALISEGLVEIVGYDADGNPLYKSTNKQ